MSVQGRSVALAQQGMVATDHLLASAAGLHVLQHGGNAIDAAVCIAGVLSVVTPMMTGVGGDTFIVYAEATGRVHALLGSGAAPRGAPPEWFAAHGHSQMPLRGMLAPSVPGAVDAMGVALATWGSGKWPLARLLEPAIHYADAGFPITERFAQYYEEYEETLAQFPSSAKIFLPEGRPPRVGEVLVQRDLARTLRVIADEGPRALYEGRLAEQIAAYAHAHGGLFEPADFAAHRSEIVPPASIAYGDLTVHTTPPPSQGFVLLEMLNILADDDLGRLPWGSAEAVHLAVEAKKLAFADRLAYAGDPRFVRNPLDRLLDPGYGRARRKQIDPRRAQERVPAGALREAVGDTTGFVAADKHGNLVSYITSISASFGCGEIAEGTGVLLNNRAGRGFTLEPGHPNVLAPGKRTMHTLMAFLGTRGGRPVLASCTRGGDAQAPWNFQVWSNILNYGMNVQEAVERPRWFSYPATDPHHVASPFELRMDAGFPDETYERLRRLGHRVVTPHPGKGGVQVIQADPDRRVYAGGSDPRTDGGAIGI